MDIASVSHGQWLFQRQCIQLLLIIKVITFASGSRSLMLISGSGCPCPGESLVFECQVDGGAATVWRISHCDKNIKLRHTGYQSDGGQVGKECNSEGKSVGVKNNSLYISQLNVTITDEVIGATVGCFKFSNNTEIAIGTLYIAVPSSPPENVHLFELQPHQLTFSWYSMYTSCSFLHYNIISDCGVCQNLTNSNMSTCGISMLSVSCSFAVEPVFCGHIKGNRSETIIVNTTMLVTPHDNKSIHCDPGKLGDVYLRLDKDLVCDPPLMSLQTRGGLVCYDGTAIGSQASQYCLCANNILIQSSATQICTGDGLWNGSFPMCKCDDKMKTITTTPLGLYAGIAITTALIVLLAIVLVTVIICSKRGRSRVPLEMQSGSHQPKADEPVYEEIVTVSTETDLNIKLDDNDAYSPTTVTLSAF